MTGVATHRESEESLTSVGQRHVNVMWETTHRQIALGVMCAFLVLCMLNGVSQAFGRPEVDIPPSLAGVVGYVVGAYFSRTNHERIGGAGMKPERQPYEGR